jgi:hypothetical protein
MELDMQIFRRVHVVSVKREADVQKAEYRRRSKS